MNITGIYSTCEEAEMDSYKISVNFEGEDYAIIVPDIETATLLQNDADALDSYMRNVFQQQQAVTMEEHHSIPDREPNAVQETIWSRKKPTDMDNTATELLLHLRLEYANKFNNQKSNKTQLWQQIASKIESHGFSIGLNAAERCRQKFANLTKGYLAYIKHQKTTGTGKLINIPPFFDELHSILGTKHKTEPVLLEDSLAVAGSSKDYTNNTPISKDETVTVLEEEESKENADMQDQIRNRFKSVKKRIRPQVHAEKVLQELKVSRECRQAEFNFLKEHLQNAEHQRERFLNILDRAFPAKKGKKRKVPSSSSSDSN